MAEISLTGDQMLNLLELVAFEGPKSTAELAVTAGINRTVAHRLLTTLHNRGYVSRHGKVFDLGPVLGQIAALADQNGLLQVTRPAMVQLAAEVGETVVLHRIDGECAVVVEQAVSDTHVVRVQHREGSRHSLAAGASGRAILAWQPDRLVERLVAQSADPRLQRNQIEMTRSNGVAISRNELQLGVAGAAVPIRETRGLVRFSLAILVPLQREQHLDNLISALVETRDRIEEQLQQSD